MSRFSLADKAGVKASLGLLLLVFLFAGASPAARSKIFRPAGLGLAAEFEENLSADAERKVLAQMRATGVSQFSLTVFWPAAEPSSGKYRVEAVTRAARVLRQSGANVHLDLPIVAGREKEVPADLASAAFDDPKLSIRLGQLLDALEPALADCSTISLGSEADVYFSDKPEALKAYRRLFDGAVDYLRKKAPGVRVGVSTLAPTESPAPVVAAMLHQRSPILFYVYAPFEPGRPYLHRSPSAIERDWKQLLDRAGGRPIAFLEVSFSSSSENGSNREMQAEFIRRLRRILGATDSRRLLFARYATLRDAPMSVPADASAETKRRAAFFAGRGLQTRDGEPKPAWNEWVKAGQ